MSVSRAAVLVAVKAEKARYRCKMTPSHGPNAAGGDDAAVARRLVLKT
jgi:hypothetical protein